MDISVSLWYPVKAFGLFAAIVVVAGIRWEAVRPFPRFGLANRITMARAFLVALAAGLIGETPRPEVAHGAIVLGLLATASDALDGWAARRTQMTSAFGARFDMEIDALLILVLAILVWQHGKAASWILMAGLLRYAFVAAGWLWPWMRAPLTPTARAKIICVVQIGTLLLCLLPEVPPPASRLVAASGLSALTYSFAVDTLRLWQGR